MKIKANLPTHLQRGIAAENAALAHLQKNGLKLQTRNFRCAAGELDLVMLEGDELVFVEVRYRSSARFGGALPSVDAGKQRKLRAAAELFLQRHPKLGKDGCRFDVAGVSGELSVEWVRDAF